MKLVIKKSIQLVFLAILLAVFALPNNTSATVMIASGFQDNESANGNDFSASSLDAEVTSAQTELQLPATAANMLAGEIVTRDGKIENVGKEDLKYNVSFDKVSGSDALCAALQITARRNGVTEYAGNLSGLDFDAPILNSLDHDDWDFSIELPLGSPANLQNLDCAFNFVFTAWQKNFAGPTQGWVDEEEIDSNNIHTGDWTAPVISNVVNHDPATTKRTSNRVNINITWKTDEMATSKVVYDTVSHAAGTPVDYLFKMPALDDVVADKINHSITLTNLNPNNTYYYRVVNRDAVGNTAYSIEYSFDIKDPVAGMAGAGTVMINEFVPDPTGNDVHVKATGEWIELYNSTVADVDAAGWYFKDNAGRKLVITTTNSTNNASTVDAGETIVPAGRYLVVYVNAEFAPNEFLDNASDTLELYNVADVLLDKYAYINTFAANKSFARIPDGGFWVDPDGTPGHENELNSKDLDAYRMEAFEKCFVGQNLKANAGNAICNLKFLDYLGMIKGEKGDKIPENIYAKFISAKEKLRLEEEAKAKSLLEEEKKAVEIKAVKEEVVSLEEETKAEEIVAPEKIETLVDVPAQKIEEEPKEELKKEPEEIKLEEPKKEEIISEKKSEEESKDEEKPKEIKPARDASPARSDAAISGEPGDAGGKEEAKVEEPAEAKEEEKSEENKTI